MSTDRIVLFTDTFWISPYVCSCFVALHEKGVPFETHAVALHDKEQLSPDYAAMSITARVPAISHGDFHLAESSAIIEYLEDVFPAPGSPPLLPPGVRERARARQILSWLRTDLLPLREERSTQTMFYDRTREPLSPPARAAAEKLVRVATQLVGDRPNGIFGEFTIVDNDLAFMLERLILNEDPIPPQLAAYAERHWARPSLRGFVERERPTLVPG